jgi:hypothetical protein
MPDLSDFVQGSDGQWYDPSSPPPPGVRLNGVPQPAPAATPGSPRIINTPNSSTGQPQFADPSATGWSTEFATPQGGQLTTTPNSRTGAPAPGIRTVPTTRPSVKDLIPSGSSLAGDASAMTGLGILAAPTLVGPTAFGGNVNTQMKDAIASDNAERQKAINFWQHPFGFTNPFATQSPATAPTPQPASPVAAPAPAPAPVAAPGSQPQMGAPWPPGSPPPPFGPAPPSQGPKAPIPPFISGPVPVYQGHAPRAPSNINLGYGAPAAPPQDPFAIHPSNAFVAIPRPNADPGTRGGMLGGNAGMANIGSTYGPRGTGGAPLATALDLSQMFNHPAVAAAAAAHPAVQGALAAQNVGPAPARAPAVQAKWKGLPQVQKGGAAVAQPTWWNPATGGANVGMGN